MKKETILYRGECVRRCKDYLSDVGYLPQKFGLFKELTIIEMLRLLASLKNIDLKKGDVSIEECVEMVNLSDRMHDRVGTLSGGMIRRLGIAQALLGDPHVIIFDEPTAGLDPEERLRFKTILSQIKENRVVILSTHIVEDVEAVCNTILIMKDGQVGASGSCAQIQTFAEGKTYWIPEMQVATIQGDYIIQKREEHNGEVMVKILTSFPQTFLPTTPQIEDGYICVLKNM